MGDCRPEDKARTKPECDRVRAVVRSGRRRFFGIEKTLQMPDAGRMAQFAQGFRFNLADAFSRDIVHLADFFKGAFVSIS